MTTRFNIDPELANQSPMTLRISSSPVSNFRATSKLQSLAGTLVEPAPVTVSQPQADVEEPTEVIQASTLDIERI